MQDMLIKIQANQCQLKVRYTNCIAFQLRILSMSLCDLHKLVYPRCLNFTVSNSKNVFFLILSLFLCILLPKLDLLERH